MRRRWFQAALAVLIGAGLVPPVLAVAPAASSTCELVPTLRLSTVNQGLGSYARLVQGKDTLVRLFLTLPPCAAQKDAIQLVGGSVTVTGGSGGEGALVPPVGSTPPTLGAALSNDSPSNPLFVVPGSALQTPTGTGFRATFVTTIRYRVKPAGQSSFGPEQSIELPRPESPAIEREVNPRSNALRVLVVPMGDGSRGYDADFPADASAATQRAMENVARMLPVPSGTSDLTSSAPAGLRYRVAPTLLDLDAMGLMRPVDGVNRFCGSGANFAAVQTQLSAFRQAWNNANPLAAADRVIGVVWQNVAIGTDAGSGCDEGNAAINGTEGWFRASTTYNGAAAGMEVLHTLGAAIGSHATAGYHSKNREADLTDPERAYNLLLRQYLADDRSAMMLSAGWAETNTVLEPNDWSHALCRLTPASTLGCLGTTVGGPAAAGSSFVLAGTVRTSGPGAPEADIHSWFEPGAVEQSPVPDSSVYALVQRRADGTELQRTRVAYSSARSDHVGAGGSTAGETSESVDVTVAAHVDAEVFELERSGAVVYRRVRNSRPAMTVIPDPALGNVRNWSEDPARSDRLPALSPDGAFVAWSDGTNVYVRDVARQGLVSAPLAGTEPAWYPSGTTRRLAFVRDGDVYLADVLTGTGVPSFTVPVPAYLAAQQVIPNAAASQPAWAPALAGRPDRLALRIGGDLWEVDVDLVPGNEPVCRVEATALDGCRPLVLTAGVEEQHPAWSARGIAYDAAPAGGIPIIRTLDPQTRQVSDTGVAGADPEWAGSRLLFSRPGSPSAAPGLFSVPADSPTGVAPARLTSSPDAAVTATAAGGVIGFGRGGSDDEIYLADLGNGSSATVIATDADGGNLLEADLFVVCGSEVIPVVVDIAPDSVDGNVARFRVAYDAGPACDEAFLRVRVTDGWSTVTQDIEGPFGEDDAPVPSIAAPVPGEYTEWESIPVAGSANDDTDPLTYAWALVHPDGAVQPLGTGEVLPDVAPPAGGWPVGTYQVRLTVSDGTNSSSTEVAIRVVDDDDNDGMPNDREACLGAGATGDPANAFLDSDGDGFVNVDDPAPCSSGSTLRVDFDPNSLQLTSSGTPITTYLRSSAISMSAVDPASVAIVRIGGLPVRFAATAWSVSRGVGTAQFSRPDVVAFMDRNGLVGTYVPVVISVTTTTGTRAHGLDDRAPFTQR